MLIIDIPRCSTCFDLGKKVNTAARSQDIRLRDLLRAQLSDHKNLASSERAVYHDKQAESVQYPDSILSLILDGSHGACVPWMRQPPGRLTALTRVPFTIFSHINHGHNKTHFYIVHALWPHDPNMFITMLHLRLLSLLDSGHKLGQPTLYLQLDNCVRENKNKYVFAYLSYLIYKGGMLEEQTLLNTCFQLANATSKVFRDIFVSFLVVGHTHEDVDQRHSSFWRWFNCRSVFWTLDHLIQKWNEGNHPQTLEVFPGCWDWKAWLENHAYHIQGVSEPHLFHIYQGTLLTL